ncbi:hypothetical protein FAI41_08030 [Acetobacteraceae bacterium]|nr:hypothetical protein FAI41_08030 [Acetobacteraceae bacterium]
MFSQICTDLVGWATLGSSICSGLSAKLWWDASRLRLPERSMKAIGSLKLQQISMEKAFDQIDTGLNNLNEIQVALTENSRANARAAICGMGGSGLAALALLLGLLSHLH